MVFGFIAAWYITTIPLVVRASPSSSAPLGFAPEMAQVPHHFQARQPHPAACPGESCLRPIR
ncbi:MULTISPECIES: hypothetical protein [Streptomyces]|uniref:hypothetical protein n=1 Tax=Streptomyces TaxID=1883 RepID=UPI002E19B15A|nr:MULTISPECIES: hypothetical protein [unclassified Streptomyces]